MDPTNPNNFNNPPAPGQPMQPPPASTSWAANSFTPAPAPMPFPPAPPSPGMAPMPQQPVSTASIAPPPMAAPLPPMPMPTPAPMPAPAVFAPAPAPAPVDIMANPPSMQNMPTSSPLTAYQSPTPPPPAPMPEQPAFQPTMPPAPMAPPLAAPQSMYGTPEPPPAWNMTPPPPQPPGLPASIENSMTAPADMSHPVFPSSVGGPIFNQTPVTPTATETPSPFGFVSPSVQTTPPPPAESSPDPMSVINEAAKTETAPDWVALSSGGQTASLSTPTNLVTETAGMNTTLPPEFSGMSGGSPAEQVYTPPISSPDSLLVPQSGVPQESPRPQGRRIPMKLAIAGVVIVLAIAGGAIYYFFGQSGPAPEAASIPATKTQLPLTNPPKTVSAATAGASKATSEPSATPIPDVQGISTSSAKYGAASPSAKPKTATASGSPTSVLERLKNR